ncbi:signal recognition particle receptor subunit beta, partial [Lecanoromycetidae sp. Uapishka_2]
MSWSDSQSRVSSLMSPTPVAIGIALLFVFSIPLFLHLVIYRSSSSTSLPSFLLIGPSGCGKTALLTLHAETRTSQAPSTVEVSLPVTTAAASSQYRSVNDPSNQAHKKIILADTPGHGKLRHHAFNSVLKPQNLKGIIFMVDAADISTSSAGGGNDSLRQAAEYLHDLLLLLQKRSTSLKSTRGPKELPVLVAANKLDLFTALPAPLVKTALESEITNVRSSRGKGLLDSGIGMNDLDIGEEKEWLGDGGEGKFEFSQMVEVNVLVSVAGGNVMGPDGPDVKQWWEWIGSNV